MVLRRCNIQQVSPLPTSTDLFEWWCRSLKQLRKELRKGFDSLLLLVAWLLWKERNQRVFQGKSQTVSELVALILDEAKVWAYAGHTHFFMLFPEFSQTPPSVAHLATGRDTFLL